MTTTPLDWKPVHRNYQEEHEQIQKSMNETLETVQVHPLTARQVQQQQQRTMQQLQKQSTTSSKKVLDPLSSSGDSEDGFTDVDPLSPLSSHPSSSSAVNKKVTPTAIISGQLNRTIGQQAKKDYLNWNLKKTAYLKKYTTDKNIPIISKIVTHDEDDATRAIKLEDRLKMRLEQLDKENKEQNVSYMTQQEYIKHLEFLNEDLMQAWNVQNDRVRSLKIVIKCSKIMAKNAVPQFYPSMFVLVCQVLDTFGKLVFQRIRERCQEVDSMTGRVISKLPQEFSARDVTEDAKEVCRNWFFKVASIRELIGRLYVEMAILGCTRFLRDDKKQMIADFERLAKTIRGIGDPLVATYARCFLARKGHELIPDEKGYLMILYEDFFCNFAANANTCI